MQTDAWQILAPDAFDHDARGLIDAAYLFFEQSPVLKSHSSDPVTLTGYRPIGVEYARWPDRHDQMETFSISGAHLNTGPRFTLDSAVSQRMYRACTDSFVALHHKAAEVVAQLFRHAAGIEDVSPGWIHRNTNNGSFLQVNSYTMSVNEPRPAQDCHEDANLVTVGTADAPGLEIMQDDGEFTPGRQRRWRACLDGRRRTQRALGWKACSLPASRDGGRRRRQENFSAVVCFAGAGLFGELAIGPGRCGAGCAREIQPVRARIRSS